MTDWLQLGLFLLTVGLLTKPIGLYIVRVLDPAKSTFLDTVLKPVELCMYRLCQISPKKEQNWVEYLKSVLCFSGVSLVCTSVLLGCQGWLPFNPEQFGAMSWDLNFNTAVSFMTNTNWQSYGGETTLSYFSQMAALTVQNFTSAAVGLGVAAAFVRGIVRKEGTMLGNFWVDLIRSTLYLLLPIAVLGAACFMAEGVPQNFSPYVTAQTLEGKTQIIAQGPVASQEAIKLIGTNGGGFMWANAAHPYENPTPLSNFLQMVLVFLIPTAQIFAFGRWVGNAKHAWCVWIAVALVFTGSAVVSGASELFGNPEWNDLGIAGANWEGKEQRIGILGSALYACVNTATSCGSTNSMLDSFTPLGGLMPMLNMQLGSAIFGGVGTGLYSILLFILLAIFLAGLIIGRTPEYLGKKIEAQDIKLAILATLPYVMVVHVFTASSCLSQWGLAGLGNSGPHGFSEILYAFSSAAANNGSAFQGLSSNTVGYNITLALSMLFGRFLIIAPVLALAGSLVQKQSHPKTFPVSGPLFIVLVIGVISLLGALTFLPALTMGPILEELLMLKGQSF